MNFKAITKQSPKGRFMEIITEVGVAFAITNPNVDGQGQRTFWTSGLWDTGASHSAITKETAEILSLPPIGETTVISAQGETVTNFYMVSLNLPHLLFLPRVMVTECATNANFGLVLGMDVICQGDFALTNVGGVSTFSFCVPAMERIDYQTRIPKRPEEE